MPTRASGLQIAFLAFAVILLSAPLGSYLQTGSIRSASADPFVTRAIPFAIFAALLLLVPAMGRQAHRFLQAPIRSDRRTEVAIVALTMIPLTWATAGARMLWAYWIDPAALPSMRVNGDLEAQLAFSGRGIAMLMLSAMAAPLLEELLFRGFLYRAFERDWGWKPALVVISVVFGAYHSFFLNAFATSLVLVALLRRTASLQAPILVHAFSNLFAWWPLMGQHILPDPSLPPEQVSTWTLHLICTAIAVVAIPAYIWSSRERHDLAATVYLESHGALPK
jgi:membrane protease YdiL (CAAX protease family)